MAIVKMVLKCDGRKQDVLFVISSSVQSRIIFLSDQLDSVQQLMCQVILSPQLSKLCPNISVSSPSLDSLIAFETESPIERIGFYHGMIRGFEKCFVNSIVVTPNIGR